MSLGLTPEIAHSRVIDDQMTFCPETLHYQTLHHTSVTGQRDTDLEQIPHNIIGSRSESTVNISELLISFVTCQEELTAYKWIRSFEP
jgi:hypothetical protein